MEGARVQGARCKVNGLLSRNEKENGPMVQGARFAES